MTGILELDSHRKRHILDTKPRALKGRRRVVHWLIASTSAAAIIVSVAVFAGVASVASTTDAAPIDEVEAVLEILSSETFDVATTDLTQSIRVSGSLYPLRRLDISAQVSGRVEAVRVRTGETVDEGAELITLDGGDLTLLVDQQRATLSGADAKHAAAVADLDRKRQLAERGVVSQADLQSAQSEASALENDLGVLRSQLKQAEVNLVRTSIAAPFPGIVATRAVEPGQTISSGTTLLTLVDQSEMVAEVVVPLKDSVKIHVGQAVQLAVRGIEGQVFPASVERINPVGEDGTRSVKIFLTLSNRDGWLRGGMFVSGNIQVAAAYQAIAVPVSAVSEVGDERYVMTIREGLARRHAVVVKQAWPDAGLVEITEGLNVGDKVLTARLPQIADGSAVELLEAF